MSLDPVTRVLCAYCEKWVDLNAVDYAVVPDGVVHENCETAYWGSDVIANDVTESPASEASHELP